MCANDNDVFLVIFKVMSRRLDAMKVYGCKYYAHQEEAEQADYDEFAETTIWCSIEELEKLSKYFGEEFERITNYLNKTKNEPESIAGEAKYFHAHYRDWDKQWKKGTPDFILAVEAPREQSESPELPVPSDPQPRNRWSRRYKPYWMKKTFFKSRRRTTSR